MRLLLWFTLFTIFSVHFTQAGIYRRYVRRNRPRPLAHPHAHNRIGRRDFQIYRPSPWPSFLFRRPRSPWMVQPQSPRMARRFRFGNERVDRVPHFHHNPQSQSHYLGNPMTTRQTATTLSSWRPLDYGSPIDRDPTFDYAPPAVERVKFISEARSRRPTARAHTGMPPYGRPPPPPPYSGYSKRPSLWKMLAHKQRSKRPYNNMPKPPLRYHGQSPNHPLYHHQVYQDQAEIFPNIQNIVYFQPTDVVSSSRRPGPGPMRMPFHPGTPTKLVEPGNVKPGSVSDASLYSSEVASKSEFKPVIPTKKTGNKEYLFTVVGYKGPIASITPVSLTSNSHSDSQKSQSVFVASSTTKRTPTILHAVKTTPVTISTTHNTAVKPFQPTESLNTQRDEAEEESVEESQIVEEVVDQPKHIQKQEDLSELDSLDMVPPSPISPVIPNSFNILDSEKIEEDDFSAEQENEIPASVVEISNDVKPRPVFNSKNNFADFNYKTSTSISVSMSKTADIPTQAPVTTTTAKYTTTSTPKPRTSPSTKATTTTSTTTEITTTTTEATTSRPTKFPRLPTMPTYKKKPTPIYARKNKSGSLGKYASSSSGSTLSKEINGSGEIVVITAGRSKVKEYKPQFIADNTQLLAFDKVAESSSPISVQTSPSPSSTTTKSPLQEFDPMQLLHSWFTKD